MGGKESKKPPARAGKKQPPRAKKRAAASGAKSKKQPPQAKKRAAASGAKSKKQPPRAKKRAAASGAKSKKQPPRAKKRAAASGAKSKKQPPARAGTLAARAAARTTRHAKAILVVAALAFAVSTVLGATAFRALAPYEVTNPDSESARAVERLESATGVRADGTVIALVESAGGEVGQTRLGEVEESMARVDDVVEVIGPFEPPNPALVSSDGTSAFVLGLVDADAESADIAEAGRGHLRGGQDDVAARRRRHRRRADRGAGRGGPAPRRDAGFPAAAPALAPLLPEPRRRRAARSSSGASRSWPRWP